MAENGRKDVFRARSGEKPTGQKGMEMGEERGERSVSPTLQSESAMPRKKRAQKMGRRGKGQNL